MNKKFLSVIMFGALLTASTGTFVSCKDYDEDISNLQEQINSQKTDLSGKITAVEGSIKDLTSAQSALQKGIDEAKAAAATAKDAAEKASAEAKAAALEAQKNAIATAKAELDKVKAELQVAINANADGVKENAAAIKAAAAKAEADLAIAIGRIQTLEAFKSTTEEALTNLGNADTKLANAIEALDAKVAAELQELGGRLTAVEAEIETLKLYKETSSAAIEGNTEKINTLIEDLEKAQEKQTEAVGKVQDALDEYISSNNQAVGQLTTQLSELNRDYLLTKAEVSRIAGEITKINEKLDVLSAALNKMVTHVSLYTTSDETYYTSHFDLNLVSAKAVRTWEFGQGFAGAISFTKDAKETWEQSFLIRVSPTNATLDPNMIRLVNSQMGDLKGLLDIKRIEAYTELLTRGISTNGLWKVTVKLADNYDEAAYEAAAQAKVNGATNDILYAVMVNDNAVEGSEEIREVVSEYGITLSTASKPVLRTLDFNVDESSVATIKNRWRTLDPESEDGTTVSYKELAWLGTTFDEPIFSGATKNVKEDNADQRNGLSAYSVKAGKTFTVNFNETTAKRVRGFYVVLDEKCAVESAPSEINAWKSYNVKGLNTVVSGPSIDLTIPEGVNAEGDYIGFRVFAVNYDGSLVDPDGKAFYVYVGETAQTVANLTLTMDSKITVPLATTVASKAEALSTANWARAKGGEYDLNIKDAEGNDVTASFDYTKFIFKNKDKATVGLLADARNLIGTDAITSVTSVEMADVTAATMKDGVTYTATITAKNGTSGIVGVATIKFTKVLPSFPATVYPFTNILVNKNLKIYPISANNQAEYMMTNVWHGISDGTAGYANLMFSEINANPAKVLVGYAPTTNTISVPSELVNPEDAKFGTKFPMAITYNYGAISNKLVNNSWAVVNHNTAWGEDFTVEFGNYIYDCTFAWKGTAPKVTYPGAVGKATYIALDAMKITDWYNEALNLANMDKADTKENTYMKSVALHFLTGENYARVDEYYTFEGFVAANNDVSPILSDMSTAKFIKLVSKSNASQGADVSTKIQLVFTDNFSYEVKANMATPFTMTFKQ